MPVPMTGDFRSPEQEVFPYQVKLAGCRPLDVLAAAKPIVPGKPHANGGGFVAATAQVEKTAYVGPNARVLGKAKVLGRARIEGHAVVTDEAVVRDDALVSGHALVKAKAVVRDRAKVRDYGRVATSVVRDDARILEHASTRGRGEEIYGNATLKGVAWVAGRTGGSAILDGHYAKSNPIDKGVWFTWSWSKGKNPGELDVELGGLALQYTFDKAHPCLAWDTHGAAHGYLFGSPRIGREPAPSGKAGGDKKAPAGRAWLELDGRSQHVELRRDVADTRDITIEVTFKWSGGAAQRLIEFAADARTRMYLTPADADGKPAFVIAKAGRAESVRGRRAIRPGAWTSLKVILSGDKGALYLDGREAGSGAVTLNPDDLRATLCLLGRGLDGHHFAGAIDEISIYSIATVDEVPPTPDPARWSIPPIRMTPSKAIMRAAPGHDPLGRVAYRFEETTGKPGGDDSDWQQSPLYVDAGLQPNVTYAYRVKMRDVNGNETKASRLVEVTWGGGKCFVQDAGGAGLVVMEAEHAHANAPAPDGHAWKPVSKPAGASGGAAMRAMPDKGGNVMDGYLAGSPRLDYLFRATAKGRHWLWARVLAHHHTADSFHAGLDFQPGDWGENIAVPSSPAWRWVRTRKPFVVDEPGIHQLSVWMREDGLVLDKLVLTTKGSYLPTQEKAPRTELTAEGPPESPRE